MSNDPVIQNRWVIGSRDLSAESKLQDDLGIPSIVAALLVQRGFTDSVSANAFLNPSLSQLHNPSSLPDYEAARKAILWAKEENELIYIHGDYDVDGVTSAAILSRFLSKIGCRVETHVPHRMKEGYGIHHSAVEAARTAGAKLFLTCDCGVGAFEQVKHARDAGMRVVVTDHHTVGDCLPEAEAVINPHRKDSVYPFPELSGAGVAFKLCEGINRDLGLPAANYWRAFLDLAALGTIADVMPLVGENRIIAKFGLERLAETQKVGLKALMQIANVTPSPEKPLRPYHVGFVLGPRLNAVGRLDDAAQALSLLLANDPEQAFVIAQSLEKVNTDRKLEQRKTIDEAVALVTERGLNERSIILVGKEGWHPGIVGIVASRLVELFTRPCFVMSINAEEGICKGSGRSISGFNLASAIEANRELLLSGGGHAAAAGCSFAIDRFNEVADAFNQFAEGLLTPEDFVPTTKIDLEVDPTEVSIQSVEFLSRLEPYGVGNPEPLFATRSMKLAQVLPTKNPEHVRVVLQAPGEQTISGIAFGIGERITNTGAGTQLNVCFKPTIDEFRGNRSLKWQVVDFEKATES